MRIFGYRFQTTGLVGVARQTVERFVERATWLHEQGADRTRIGEYVKRCHTWVTAGVGALWNAEKTFRCWVLCKRLEYVGILGLMPGDELTGLI